MIQTPFCITCLLSADGHNETKRGHGGLFIHASRSTRMLMDQSLLIVTVWAEE